MAQDTNRSLRAKCLRLSHLQLSIKVNLMQYFDRQSACGNLGGCKRQFCKSNSLVSSRLERSAVKGMYENGMTTRQSHSPGGGDCVLVARLYGALQKMSARTIVENDLFKCHDQPPGIASPANLA